MSDDDFMRSHLDIPSVGPMPDEDEPWSWLDYFVLFVLVVLAVEVAFIAGIP